MNPDVIADWRETYGDVYNFTIGGTEFWFRALSVYEIENITTDVKASVDAEDIYLNKAILYPQNIDFDDYKAGHVSKLAEEIMMVSGVLDVSFVLSTLLEKRSSMQTDVVGMMKAFIIGAMPAYREEDLNSLTVKQLTEKVVLAEQIHTLHQNINGIPSDGVEFQITLDGAEEEQPQPKQPQRAVPREMVDKETLLKRIRQDEKEMIDSVKVRPSSQFENFDEEVLLKAAGVLKPNDPIAAKLHQAFGG